MFFIAISAIIKKTFLIEAENDNPFTPYSFDFISFLSESFLFFAEKAKQTPSSSGYAPICKSQSGNKKAYRRNGSGSF